MLSLPGAQFQSLVKELRFHIPHSQKIGPKSENEGGLLPAGASEEGLVTAKAFWNYLNDCQYFLKEEHWI